MSLSRAYRAGESIEDFCRACKTDRLHTVIVVDAAGVPLRVACGYCDSQHNFRGGPRIESAAPLGSGRHASVATPGVASGEKSLPRSPSAATHDVWPLVSERERIAPPMTLPSSPGGSQDLELLLRQIIRQESGLTPAAPAQKWRGGLLVLRPGAAGLQEKSWPIETFFHKIVMLRNRLRTLEQQVNASDLPDDVKIKLQGYVSGCYGSLTSFNVLFADEDDQFHGIGGD